MMSNPYLKINLNDSSSNAIFESISGLDTHAEVFSELTLNDGKLSGFELIRWLSGKQDLLLMQLELRSEALILAKWRLTEISLTDYKLKPVQTTEAFLQFENLIIRAKVVKVQ